MKKYFIQFKIQSIPRSWRDAVNTDKWESKELEFNSDLNSTAIAKKLFELIDKPILNRK